MYRCTYIDECLNAFLYYDRLPKFNSELSNCVTNITFSLMQDMHQSNSNLLQNHVTGWHFVYPVITPYVYEVVL